MIATSTNGYKMAQIALRMETGEVISVDCQEVRNHPSSTQITKNREKDRKAVKGDAISAKELAI